MFGCLSGSCFRVCWNKNPAYAGFLFCIFSGAFSFRLFSYLFLMVSTLTRSKSSLFNVRTER